MDDCIFCQLEGTDRIVSRNRLALCIRDGFPVTPLHTLIIPIRHEPDYFLLTPEEQAACNELLHEQRQAIQHQDPTVEGFNIGINVGPAAGQTVFHCHLHLIPRRAGDHPKPRGGIRAVIPSKADYSA